MSCARAVTEWFDHNRLAALEHQARQRREAERRRLARAAMTGGRGRNRAATALRSALRARRRGAAARSSQPATRAGSVTELRLVVTATDFDETVTFFRDALGLPDTSAVAST